MLFYVECGIRFSDEYGDGDDRFYNSMGSVYANACEFIHKNSLETEFQARAMSAVVDTLSYGWRFNEYLADVYTQYFDDLEEE